MAQYRNVGTFREGNQKLRAELAVMTSYRDRLVVISNSVIEERDCLRAELANTEGLLADARTEISHYMLSLSEVRTELATLREQHSRVLAENEFGRQAGEAKDARIAELEQDLTYGHEAGPFRATRARAERAEDALKEQLETKKWYTDRAERAEARIAELEAWGDGLRESLGTTISTMEEERARAEGAETSHEQQVIVAANYAERAERAEAELKAVREALDWIYGFLAYVDSYHSRMIRDKVRAALAPSPAGEKT